MNKIFSLLAIILFSGFAQAVEMGIPIQLKLKSPSGDYPTDSGLTFTVQVLAPSGGCVLREETFAGQTITSGTISLALGTGTPGAKDASPAISLNDVYSNAAIKNGLTCVDSSNNITGTGQSYNPAATDTRIIRVMTTISGDNILADFIQRAVPYAIQAESVGGKAAADILVQNGSTSLNQTNLESLLSNATKFNKLTNLAANGIADSATTATTAGTATNFTANLLGDITGTQSATVVSAIRGIVMAATAPVSGQVIGYDGTQYVPMTFVASAPVASVNGQMGAVVLDVSDISGALSSGSALAGDVTGTIAATVVSSVGGKTAAAVATAVTDVNSATVLPTASTIAKRDGSGNLTAATILATNASTQNVYLFEGTNTNSVRLKAANSFSDYVLVLPTSDGNSGEYLQTDGSGNLSWSASSVTSASIAAALGFTPANSSLVALKSNNLSDLASSATARTNLGLAGAALLNVGTTAGTVAAGDDSRIVNALTAATNYSGDVSGTYNSLVLINSGVNAGTYGKVTVNAKGLITSGASLTSADVTTALGFTPANDSASSTYATKASNLSDLASSATARTNLGLAGAALLNVGTTAGTVAAGDDSRIVNALTAATNYSGDVSGTYNSLVLINSGVNAGTYGKVTVNAKGLITSGASLTSADVTTALGFTPANDSASSTYATKASNLSDLASSASARTNLGLAGAALLNVGTTAGTVAAGDDSRITGALQQTGFDAYVASASCTNGQSMYWNSVSSTFLCQNILVSGDLSGIASNATVTKVQGVGVSFSSIASNHILQYNGTNIINRAIPTCAGGEYLTFNGTAWSCVTDAGGGGTIASLSVTAPISSTGGANPTLSMAAATGSANGYLASADWTTFNNKVSATSAAVIAALGYTPTSSTALGNYLAKASNLSDLASSATARTNLGLGGAALLNVGTTAGTVAAGDDSRIVNALTASTNYSGDVSGTYNSLVLVNSGVNAGTYTKFTVNAKGIITSGTSLTSSDVTTALGFTPANNAASGTYVVKASNLSDLASATVARTNLGLGSLSIANFVDLSGSQASGTLAAARLPAFTGDATSAIGTSALTLASVGAGVTSGTQYTKVTVDGKGRVTSGASLSSADVTTALGFTPANNAASGTYVVKTSNLSDLASATVARTNLGLGGAAILNVGTIAGTVAAGDDARITGSLSQTSFNTYVAGATCTTGQSMYWNSVSSLFDCQNITVSGDISGIASSVTVTKLQGTGVSFASIASNHILQYNGTDIVNRAIPTCGASQYLTFNGTAWSCAADIGSAGIVSAITVAAPLQSTGGSAPTLSMTQATGSVSGYLTGTDWTTFNNKITSSAASVEQVLGFSPADSVTVLLKANNLSDLIDVALARTNLGLGTFATASSIDLGSASATGTLDPARLPAFAGDVSSTAGSNSLTVEKIQGVSVDATAPVSGQVLAYDGTAWAPAIGLTRYGRVTANQTIPNTTYLDVTNFSFPVVSGNAYKFRFNVIFSIPSTTRAPRFLLSTPAVTVVAAQAQVPSTTTVFTTTIIAAQSGTVVGANNGVNGQILISIIEGIIVPSANGNVKLQASPSGVTNMTVYQGSTMEWTQVP